MAHSISIEIIQIKLSFRDAYHSFKQNLKAPENGTATCSFPKWPVPNIPMKEAPPKIFSEVGINLVFIKGKSPAPSLKYENW